MGKRDRERDKERETERETGSFSSTGHRACCPSAGVVVTAVGRCDVWGASEANSAVLTVGGGYSLHGTRSLAAHAHPER